MKKYLPLTLLVFLIPTVLLFRVSSKPKENLSFTNQEVSVSPKPKKLKKPEMIIDQSKDYQAVLKTSKGEITIDLKQNQTPTTVNNFVYLAKNDFYQNTTFHRVIKGFMIQGGDPKGDGTGGPGYQFDDEPFEGKYTRGTVAMANSGPNTNGSQFFIMHQDYDLPANYVIFGQVTKGIEVVDQIATSKTKAGSSGENSTPVEPTTIESVTIIAE